MLTLEDFSEVDEFPAAPIVFPAGYEAVALMTVPQLTALEIFYGLAHDGVWVLLSPELTITAQGRACGPSACLPHVIGTYRYLLLLVGYDVA